MTPKEIFSLIFYEGLKEAIANIPEEHTKDVYICKLFIDNFEKNDITNVSLKYNTNAALQKQIEEIAGNWEKYAEQSCGWYGKEGTISHAKTVEFRQIAENLSEEDSWKRLPIKIDFYAYKNYLDWKNQIDYTDEDDKEYEFSAQHFKNLMVELGEKLFDEEIILRKFGKKISFFVECECDEDDEIDVLQV